MSITKRVFKKFFGRVWYEVWWKNPNPSALHKGEYDCLTLTSDLFMARVFLSERFDSPLTIYGNTFYCEGQRVGYIKKVRL